MFGWDIFWLLFISSISFVIFFYFSMSIDMTQWIIFDENHALLYGYLGMVVWLLNCKRAEHCRLPINPRLIEFGSYVFIDRNAALQ